MFHSVCVCPREPGGLRECVRRLYCISKPGCFVFFPFWTGSQNSRLSPYITVTLTYHQSLHTRAAVAGKTEKCNVLHRLSASFVSLPLVICPIMGFFLTLTSLNYFTFIRWCSVCENLQCSNCNIKAWTYLFIHLFYLPTADSCSSTVDQFLWWKSQLYPPPPTPPQVSQTTWGRCSWMMLFLSVPQSPFGSMSSFGPIGCCCEMVWPGVRVQTVNTERQ